MIRLLMACISYVAALCLYFYGVFVGIAETQYAQGAFFLLIALFCDRGGDYQLKKHKEEEYSRRHF